MQTPSAGIRALGRIQPASVVALMMFLLAAAGVPGELVLQDTLKSALVVFGTLSGTLLLLWQRQRSPASFWWHRVLWLPVVLVLSACASMTWSQPYLAAVEAIRWSVFGLLVWLGLNSFTRDNLAWVALGIHAGVAMAAVWAGLQFYADLSLFPQAAVPASTFVNRNFFAEYAVCALPFSVFTLVRTRTGPWLVVNTLAVVLVIVAILLTGTRSALLALGLLLPMLVAASVASRHVLALGRWGRVRSLALGLAIVAGVMVLGSLPGSDAAAQGAGNTAWQRSTLRAASLVQAEEHTSGTIAVRTALWKSTLRMIASQPWRGVGAGAWEAALPRYQQGGATGQETDYYAHNEFLQLLAEYGVVVGGLFLAILLACGALAAQATWQLQRRRDADAPLRWFALISLLALALVSFFGFPWRLAGTGALFALCVAMLVAPDARLRPTQGQRVSLPSTPGPLCGAHVMTLGSTALRWSMLACCAAMVAAVLVTVQAIRAESRLVRAIQLARSLPPAGAPPTALATARKAALLQLAAEGIAIHPHDRKLTSVIGNALAASGDWVNAAWVWESVAASRPDIPDLWWSIVVAQIHATRYERALRALENLQRLEPGSHRAVALQALVLARTGHAAQAATLLGGHYERGDFNLDLLQVGYSVAIDAQHWPLAIRALELRNQHFPALAVDGHFRLGAVFSDPRVDDRERAEKAYRQALQLARPLEREALRRQMPEPYRSMPE